MAASCLSHLATGEPIDAVRQAVLREAFIVAGMWHDIRARAHTAILDVLAAEQRLSRQLGALQIMADDKLYRQLHDLLQAEQTAVGTAIIAGFVLLQRDRANSEQRVFDVYWQASPGTKRTGLVCALQLCGIVGRLPRRTLDNALASDDEAVVRHAAKLVGRIGWGHHWQTPNLKHAAGLRAAVALMGARIIAPAAPTLARAQLHHAPSVRVAFEETFALLYPQAALAQARDRAHRLGDVASTTLNLLGLLHDGQGRAAERDFALLVQLSRTAGAMAAAVEALGLAGRDEGAAACLAAAHADPKLASAAQRSLQAIYGLDDESWAALLPDDLDMATAPVLEAGLARLRAHAMPDELSDFQPRTPKGFNKRMRACDVAHLRHRAAEGAMRSRGRLRLSTWAFLTPQLALVNP